MNNIPTLIQYLSDKGEKTRTEKLALQALQDTDFMEEYDNLSFATHTNQFQNVLNNPSSYDQSDDSRRAYYRNVVVDITNTYGTYLYDNKSKYSSLRTEINSLQTGIEAINSNIENIENVSELISGERVLRVYAKEYKKRFRSYERTARFWEKRLYNGFFLVGVLTILFFFFGFLDADFIKKYASAEMAGYAYFAVIGVKVIILIGIVQLVKFFGKNYNANKHLANQSLHKHDVLKALQGVYNTINDAAMKNELIKTGALVAFQNTESGYITRKEGAGGSDAGLSSIIAALFKK